MIDITPYLRADPPEGEDDDIFTLWGAEGERTRFALPLWRAAYMFRARRAALVWIPSDDPPATPAPLTLLDLGSREARLDFEIDALVGLEDEEIPGRMAHDEERLAVYLGELDDRRWYLVADDRGPEPEDEDDEEDDDPPRPLTDVLFLAGECSGLLFFRNLARNADGFDDEEY